MLGTELVPGHVRLSKRAHRHIAEDHQDDYAICLSALPVAISNPSFVGQAPGHAENFEIVRRMNRADGREVLVAIGLEPDKEGCYRIVSAYLIDRGKVDRRRRAKRLLSLLP